MKLIRKQLENIFAGTAKDSNRGAVVEVQPSGGSIDKEAKTDVKVEKFGSESASDSMFENYDEKCERRIRRAFRLPPLFVGQSDDLNFASAHASYIVAEAQVFKPERDEFDGVFNNTVMVALDPLGNHKLRSKQISIKDIDTQLKALGMTKGMDGVDEKSWVTALAEVSSVDISYDEDKAEEEKTFRRSLLTNTGNNDGEPVIKSESSNTNILGLVDDFLGAMHLVKTDKEFTERDRYLLMEQIQYLTKQDRSIFDAVFSSRALPADLHDVIGARELCGCMIDHQITGQ